MKFLATFAFLCLLQAIAGHAVKDQHHENHINKPVGQAQHHNSGQQGQQGHDTNSHQHEGEEEDVALPSQQHVVLHVTEPSKAPIKVQQMPLDSKVTVQIPPKVQQIVAQISQHIPQVIAQHVASKQRAARSVQTIMDWREMQVNAVEQPGKCQYICNQVDATVCGYNGRCYWQFASQCDLSTYNCLNTDKIFQVVNFGKCQDVGAAKCYRGDL